MNNSRQFIFGLIVAILAIFFTFKNVPADELKNSFHKMEYIYIFPTVLIILLSYIVRVYRWRILILHIKPVSVNQLFSPMMIGLLGNMLPMRAGEILRAYLLKKKINMPFTSSLATIMIERMFDVLMLNIFFTWILVFHSNLFGPTTIWLEFSLKDIAYNFGLLSGFTFFLLLTLIYFVTYKTQNIFWLVEKTKKPFPPNWVDKCKHLIETFSKGLSSIRDKKALAKVGFYSLLDWILLIFSAYPLYLAFDLNNKTIESMVVLAVIVPIFMSLLPTPSFVGSVQAGVFVALHKIMGEDPAIAAAYGIVGWACTIIIQLLAGIFFLFREHISYKAFLKFIRESKTDLNKL